MLESKVYVVLCDFKIRTHQQELLSAGRAIRRSMVLICSQKTLSVAALLLPQIAAQPGLRMSAGQAGIAMIVCVFTYIAQLAIDFMIASAWSRNLV